jgi:hypothetical protein
MRVYKTPEKKKNFMTAGVVLFLFFVLFSFVAAADSAAPEQQRNITAGATPQRNTHKPMHVDGINISEKNGDIVVEWNDTKDASVAGYNLYYKKAGDRKFSKVNRNLITESSAVLGGLKTKIRYFFMATSVSKDGVESDYSGVVSG